MSTALQVIDVAVERGGNRIVEGVDIDVPIGSITALLGSNGAGKTTLIEAICGRLRLAHGQVVLDGVDVSKRRPVDRARYGLATVEQGRTVFKSLSTADNLRVAASGQEDVERAVELFPELRSKLTMPAGLLSGGEQQMLALARALVMRPKVLVIDEMSLGLAPLVVSRLLPFLKELAGSQGIGILVVEQFAALALRTADHAYVLRKGRIVYDGPADELLGDPERLHEAYFGVATKRASEA
jgi:branched-chain amino acid transport system ATP-binding protein